MSPLVNPVERFREAMALHRAGDVDRAETLYREILRENPEHPGAMQLLGLVLHSRRDLRGALQYIEKALSLCDSKGVYWNNYGVVLKDAGKHREAKRAFEKSISICDSSADAWSNLGWMQIELGILDEAEKSIRHALRLDPQHADALTNLAVVYREKREFDEALRLCKDAAVVAPGESRPYEIEGSVLAAARRFEEAVVAYDKAIARNPDAADAHLSRGIGFAELDEIDEARAAFQRAANLRPDRPAWSLRHLNLCPVVFESTSQIESYRADLHRQLDDALTDPPPFDWRRALQDGVCPSFQLAHHGVCNRRLKEKFARLFAPAFPGEKLKLKRRGKIRVGFLCTAGHEGGYFRGYGGIMSRLDRSRFEVVGLVSNSIVEKCRKTMPDDNVRWVSFSHNLPQAYAVIRGVDCDVVAHRHVGTDTMNYFLPFLPLAPIQTIGSGMHGTTGIANIDYGVSSRLFERGVGAAEDYSETLVQFDGINSWQRRPQFHGKATRDDFGLPPSGTLYLCPQRLAKVLPDFDTLLAQILERNEEGHVVILDGSRTSAGAKLRKRLERRVGARPTNRIHFLPRQKANDYFRLMNLADVVLDTPNYSTSYTGYDALGLGVPVVTMPGKYMVQRYALGLYRHIDFLDLVTSNEQEYVDLAVRLGRDEEYRRAVGVQIRERSDALFEDSAVIHEYEEFFSRAVEERLH